MLHTIKTLLLMSLLGGAPIAQIIILMAGILFIIGRIITDLKVIAKEYENRKEDEA